MNDRRREQAFLEKTKTALDESVESLDASTLARLHRSRNLALETGRRSAWFRHGFRAPVAGLLATAAAVLFMIYYSSLPSGLPSYTNPGDIELLVAGDNPEFYAELDFYVWLAEEENNAG